MLNLPGKKTAVAKKAAPAVAAKKPAEKKPAKPPATVKTTTPGSVSIRMYCIGTGDCFVLKFLRQGAAPFVMMIDCGSCQGDKEWFKEYVEDLEKYVANKIDLLVVTHEHTDHVNGFEKWPELFKRIDIKEAWFAWTENPIDPGGVAAELLKKRTAMKAALGNAIATIKKRKINLAKELASHPFKNELMASQNSFINGLNSLATVNLPVDEKAVAANNTADPETFAVTGAELPGMHNIKEILQEKKVKIRYLSPGETVTINELDGVRFYVLGPPSNREAIFKDGREGTDVYKKNMALNESTLSAKAFSNLGNANIQPEDLPFTDEYIVGRNPGTLETDMMDKYYSTKKYAAADEDWRRVDDEWLMSAGLLALRLNSHINNTSLALAVESVKSEKILLLPGDAEYGSWESWHLIDVWKNKGKNGKHLVEDLLNRTVFYKVGHHLSYNGTALEKGIKMMPGENMAAMATLDRERISSGWKTTMPNKLLMQELIHKTGGLFFIMNEADMENAPSLPLDPTTLNKDVYEQKKRADSQAFLYKQYTLAF